jgi:hypothetical protein
MLLSNIPRSALCATLDTYNSYSNIVYVRKYIAMGGRTGGAAMTKTQIVYQKINDMFNVCPIAQPYSIVDPLGAGDLHRQSIKEGFPPSIMFAHLVGGSLTCL